MAGTSAEGVRAVEPASRFAFRLAEASDDAALRALLRDTPMDGAVQVALCREPSYFAAAAVEGPARQTLVVTDLQTGRIVAMGARSVRDRFVEGNATPIGYLSGLRILPEYRRGTLLARGYRELRRLHDDGAAHDYVTTIADGNQPAVRALTGGRARLPGYHLLGKYYTLVLPLRSLRGSATPRRGGDELEIRPLRDEELAELIRFATEVGRSRLFFPCYRADDLCGPQATFRDLAAKQILTAWRGSRLVACLGLWNQTAFKQSVIRGYRGSLRWTRRVLNPPFRILGWPQFPPVGEALSAITAALPLAAEGETEAFSLLLKYAQEQARKLHPLCDSLLVGLCENDPLFDLCRRASLFHYVTCIYVVSWDEEPARSEPFHGRRPYLELGCL